jgi:hypothetical protein
MVTGMMSTRESTTRLDNAAVLYTDNATVDGRGDITSKINVDILNSKTAETISNNVTDVQSTEPKIKSSSKGTTNEKQFDLIESTSSNDSAVLNSAILKKNIERRTYNKPTR